MIFNLPELFAGDAHFTARRDSWPEAHKIMGVPARRIKNKDIKTTLVLDERIMHFVEGNDIEVAAHMMMWDGKRLHEYSPNNADSFASDWTLSNETELIENLISRPNLKEE